MKIAHVLRRLSFDDWGGTEQVVWNIVKAQKAAGHEVQIFATTALWRGLIATKNAKNAEDAKTSLRPLRSLRLKIIGKDEGEGPRLRRMASNYNLDVEFCGIVSEESKNAAYEWCDALVLPTLSENFGLVIAEALERGKRVITTDGAPAWSPSASAAEDKGDGNDYGGRLIYLRGYRDGSPEDRIRLLVEAITSLANA